MGTVAQGVHLGDRTAQHDELAVPVAARFEQYRVHRRLRLGPGGGGLHRLGTTDLGAVRRDDGVQRHVLGLERRDPHPFPGQPSAQPSGDDALARVRSRSGDQQRAAAHRPFRRRARLDVHADQAADHVAERAAEAAAATPADSASALALTAADRTAARSRSAGWAARPYPMTGRCSTPWW